MGVWGSGLYAGDFAMDLRSAIKAVARLPYGGDRLVEILSGTEPAAANNSNDEQHTTFWLVVADQFAKRAIVCDRAREKALTIIDAGTDLTVHAELGMSPSDLSKRRKMLQELRVRLTTPLASKRRSVLKEPQAYLMGKLRRSFPAMPPGIFEAIDDVSIANSLNVGRSAQAIVLLRPYSTILGIDQLL